MRVVEKSAINQLISEAKNRLEKQKGSYFGTTMNTINAIEWMKTELDTLRKELNERVIEVRGNDDEKIVFIDDPDFRDVDIN